MITIDGTDFDIPIISISRKADVLDKFAERLENGDLVREIIGVYFNYSLKLGQTTDVVEYAALWNKLTEAVEFHEVVVPDESGDYTFTAYFANISDELRRTQGALNFWRNLTVNFIAKSPARTP